MYGKILIKHEFINNDNYIVIINHRVNNKELKNSYKLLDYKYSSSNVNTETIMSNHSYYDRTKYTLTR